MSDELKPCPFCGEMPPVFEKEQCAPIVGHACRILDLQITVPLHTWNARAERTCRKVPGKMHFGERRPKCSECGYGLGDSRWVYCPKCGARIEGGQS